MPSKTGVVTKTTESTDPLWLDIKKGLDAAVAGKLKLWKPRYIKAK